MVIQVDHISMNNVLVVCNIIQHTLVQYNMSYIVDYT